MRAYYKSLFFSLWILGCTSVTEPGEVYVLDKSKFDKIRQSPNVLILDVRTLDEYKAGHIPGAVNIDFYSDDFEQKVKQIRGYDRVLVYCASGRRSTASIDVLKKAGFSYIGNLDGGYNKWSRR
jgi:rhodanese-related sulfurtransferase